MTINNTQPVSPSFGIKVPTKDVISLISGNNSTETTKLLCELTGIPKDKMLTTMSSDVIQFSKDYCAKEIANTQPAFKNLLEIKQTLSKAVKDFAAGINRSMENLNSLFQKRDSEITKLSKELGENIDINSIKLPL